MQHLYVGKREKYEDIFMHYSHVEAWFLQAVKSIINTVIRIKFTLIFPSLGITIEDYNMHLSSICIQALQQNPMGFFLAFYYHFNSPINENDALFTWMFYKEV